MRATALCSRPCRFVPCHVNPITRKSSVIVYAGDESKVVREYREDDGSVNVPGLKKGEQLNPDGTMYIDQAEVRGRQCIVI